MLNRFLSDILMKIFLWSGSQLFSFIDVYSPYGEDDDMPVTAIVFAEDEEAFNEAIQDLHTGNPATVKVGPAIRKG